MATSFQGWLNSWNGWGANDPNAMRGSATITFIAALQVNSGEMQGAASFSIDATGTATQPTTVLPELPRYYSVNTDAAVQAKRRQQLEEDEVILAIIQQFVMEA